MEYLLLWFNLMLAFILWFLPSKITDIKKFMVHIVLTYQPHFWHCTTNTGQILVCSGLSVDGVPFFGWAKHLSDLLLHLSRFSPNLLLLSATFLQLIFQVWIAQLPFNTSFTALLVMKYFLKFTWNCIPGYQTVGDHHQRLSELLDVWIILPVHSLYLFLISSSVGHMVSV